ncbi:hypothetical protein OHA63_19015 [Streptomyces anulatus]|uniref:hypothetical protein n=1 Tax=Streptomyces anulatus TaxID=1892 RepID=UPI002E355DBA|nr:hypothetical protein [Streptomyces anulatus]
MDWTKQAQHDFQDMPAEASDLVMSARAELITAEDPYFRGIDADASLPALNGRLICAFKRHHAHPRIVVTEVFSA